MSVARRLATHVRRIYLLGGALLTVDLLMAVVMWGSWWRWVFMAMAAVVAWLLSWLAVEIARRRRHFVRRVKAAETENAPGV